MYSTDVLPKKDIRWWVLEIEFLPRKFGQRPISEVPDQMVETLGMSDKTKGRDAGDLIFRTLGKKREKVIRIWLRANTL